MQQLRSAFNRVSKLLQGDPDEALQGGSMEISIENQRLDAVEAIVDCFYDLARDFISWYASGKGYEALMKILRESDTVVKKLQETYTTEDAVVAALELFKLSGQFISEGREYQLLKKYRGDSITETAVSYHESLHEYLVLNGYTKEGFVGEFEHLNNQKEA